MLPEFHLVWINDCVIVWHDWWYMQFGKKMFLFAHWGLYESHIQRCNVFIISYFNIISLSAEFLFLTLLRFVPVCKLNQWDESLTCKNIEVFLGELKFTCHRENTPNAIWLTVQSMLSAPTTLHISLYTNCATQEALWWDKTSLGQLGDGQVACVQMSQVLQNTRWYCKYILLDRVSWCWHIWHIGKLKLNNFELYFLWQVIVTET